MLIAAVLLNICVLLALSVGGYYAKRRVESAVGSALGLYTNFVNKKNPESLSPLEQNIEAVSGLIVDRLKGEIASFKGQSMAEKSHLSRQANLLAQDMLQDDVSQVNPILGMILERYPSVRKRLAKSPMAVQALMPIISQMNIPDPTAIFQSGAGDNGNGHKTDNDWVKRLGDG